MKSRTFPIRSIICSIIEGTLVKTFKQFVRNYRKRLSQSNGRKVLVFIGIFYQCNGTATQGVMRAYQ
jgi:hypothetical protein